MQSSTAITIALVSLSVSLGGLAWQLSLYRLSGARLKLDLRRGVFTHRGTLVRWSSRGWPKESPDAPGLSEGDLWVEIAQLIVANLGRTVVWVSDLGLDFGRSSRWRRRSRVVVTLRPLAVGGGLADNLPVRLEPGQSASMYVPIEESIVWAKRETKRRRVLLRASITFGGLRVKRSARRRAWRVAGDAFNYPHLTVTRQIRIFRELLSAWPTSDVANLYEAWVEVSVALDDPKRGPVSDVLEPFIPNLVSRLQLAHRLQTLGGATNAHQEARSAETDPLMD